MRGLRRFEPTKAQACEVGRFKGRKVYADYESTLALIRSGQLGVLPGRAGDCYRLAYTAAIDGFGDYLIGACVGKDEPFIYHAVAVSRDDMTLVYYDGTLDACFAAPVYDRLFRWMPICRMSVDEAREFVRRTGKFPSASALNFVSLND